MEEWRRTQHIQPHQQGNDELATLIDASNGTGEVSYSEDANDPDDENGGLWGLNYSSRNSVTYHNITLGKRSTFNIRFCQFDLRKFFDLGNFDTHLIYLKNKNGISRI